MPAMRLRLLIAAALVLSLAAPAGAAPRWSAPFTVAPDALGVPGVAIDARGGALFAATGAVGILARSRAADGTLGTLTVVTAPLFSRVYTDPVPTLTAGGSGVLAWTQRDLPTDLLSSQIRTYAAKRSASGVFAQAIRVEPTSAERAGDPRVAIDPRGRAFVTYDDFGTDVSRALATVAPAGRRFGSPTPLFSSPDTGRRPDVAVGYGTRASVAIVHQRLTPRSDGAVQIQGDVQVLNATASTGFGGLANVVHTDRLSSARLAAFGPPAIAVGRDGATAVAWTQPRPAACLRGVCHDVYVALRAPGARRFGDPVKLASAGGYQGEQPAVVVDQDQAVVAWHERLNGVTNVVTASAGLDGVASPSTPVGVDLLRSIDARPALAVDGLGSVVAAWITPNASGTAGAPFFAIRPRGLPFSRPVPVKRARAARGISVAAGRGGHAALAWLEDRSPATPFTRAAVVAQVRTP
jgi:hypothetical protein